MTNPFGAALALGLFLLCGLLPLGAQEMSAEIIAAQIRDQGYACTKALSAERDEKLSKPDEVAWILKCNNATYRARLIPDMAAKVEKLD
jgi:hypothetical protein